MAVAHRLGGTVDVHVAAGSDGAPEVVTGAVGEEDGVGDVDIAARENGSAVADGDVGGEGGTDDAPVRAGEDGATSAETNVIALEGGIVDTYVSVTTLVALPMTSPVTRSGHGSRRRGRARDRPGRRNRS